MSPRDFDAAVVQTRLRMMNDLLSDLADVGEVSAARLTQDRMLRHAVERILTQLVELAVSVNGHVAATQLGKSPADYRASFSLAATLGCVDADLAARLGSSVGLRNVLVHEYVDTDLAIVADAVGRAVVDYRDYVRGVSRWLQNHT